MTSARSTRRGTRGRPAQGRRRWSQQVTLKSNALDLERGVFTRRSARAVAASLKRSADRSRRRKAPAFRSAMSMLNFYLNRAGRGLPAGRRHTLEKAKDELRRLYGKPASASRRRLSSRTR